MKDEVIDIGSRRELFVDEHLIDRMEGAELELHRPMPREVAIVHDAPWEGNTCFYHTVFQDGQQFRMYYRGAHHDEAAGKVAHEVVCYAESRDGIHWTKPELGVVQFEGSKQNNIVWDGLGSHDFAPFKDANPATKPDEQYKALARGPGGLYGFTSPDGIYWSLVRDHPLITEGAFDSQNLAFWDSVRGRYVDFHRHFQEEGGEKFRDIMTCTSTDFIHWTDPVWLDYPGAPREHLYTNQIISYYRAPHIFLGFPKRFVPSRVLVQPQRKGLSDGLFMSSRDGLHFKRWGEAFIRPGLQPERWVNRNNMIAWGILETAGDLPGTPNELSLYSIEGYYQGEECQMRRFTLRLDGFVSVRAPLRGGELVTRPLVFEGRDLAINFSTSAAGRIDVEVQDVEGRSIPGFALEDGEEIFGDAVEQVVRWKNGSDVSQLEGQPVRLRFRLSDADLYAVQFR